MSSYLFIPHSPLQFEVFEYWAEATEQQTDMKTVCLLITEDLRSRLSDTPPYSFIFSLDELVSTQKTESLTNQINYLKRFEDNHPTCLFSEDWSIDRAFQNISLSHNKAIAFTAEVVEKISSVISTHKVKGAMSEKLFLPQRIVHHILAKKGYRHILPIGDRFFPRFYFESGLNEWYWEKILIAYKNNQSVSLKDIPQAVKDVYDKVVLKSYKKVFADAKSKKKKSDPSIVTKIQSRLNKPLYTNIYSEYLYGGLKLSLLEKLAQKKQRKQNLEDYNLLVTKEIPSSKFVLFLFHMQPEYTVDGIAIKYYNQVEFVTNIARNLPADISIVVKENPRTVGVLHRPKSYYKDLERHPNITFLHHSIDAHKLVKKSMAVVTLTGTVGIEALLMDKPVIIVGNIFYRFFDRVFSVNSVEEVLEAIQKIDKGAYIPFVTKEEKYLFGLKVLKSFYDATFPGQMYNGFSPEIHRTGENKNLLQAGFIEELQSNNQKVGN